MISIKINWNDNIFENKYEFINRFKGEFYYWDYIEIFVAVKIIYLEDTKLFEEIIKKDDTFLLSLNLPFNFLGVEVSESFVLSMINDSDELYKNIGFYILTNKLNHYIRELEQNQRAKELGIEDLTVNNKKLEKKISLEVNRVLNNLSYCDDATKVSLMVNYFISEAPVIVTRFADLLLDIDLEQKFINELKGSNKIKTLDNIYHLLRIVSNTKRKKTKGHTKTRIYNVFVDLIILFVKDRKGIYQWSEKEEYLMIEICKLLPKKSKEKLLRNLINESKGIMDRKLDELLRFEIYLKDKNRSQIINGMIGLLRGDLFHG
ncbi:hypothetical protein [Siminovitchia fordii]|uniref:Uncharacterized protein n=1 Tax=Siminovitchia fordii TaxID=254759 RepID=A0ABQ4KEA6_9BACI|nr:hypothetical protein [Siminovitchia fordii]GIN23406.1 hypothetical protein J1TS3_45400 [Siminovitchia fordii]